MKLRLIRFVQLLVKQSFSSVRLTPLLTAPAIGALIAATAVQAQTTTSGKDRLTVARDVKVKVNPDGYTNARVCGTCHENIYKTWKRSMHALSIADPIFDVAYMQALKEIGEEAQRKCLRCHAPMVTVNKDYDLSESVTTEGVSCDFCHTVTAVHLDNPERPFSTSPGLVKRSVLKDADSPAHEVAYSELHGKAEFCGGCHNYLAPNGTPIMGTYNEWAEGPYAAEGTPCQHCHMGLRPGRVVREDVQKSNTKFHVHDLIHDSEQLKTALTMELLEAETVNDQLRVTVRVANTGSGHKVPTGIPSRQIRLKVLVSSAGRQFERERIYEKVLADEGGRILTRDVDMLLYGARIISDTRIGPREERIEHFSFALPSAGKATVSASLNYTYSPVRLEKQRMDIQLGADEKTVYFENRNK